MHTFLLWVIATLAALASVSLVRQVRTPVGRWRLLNLLQHRYRGVKQELLAMAKVGTLAQLHVRVIRADGRIEDLGLVSRRVVTTAGANFIAACFTNANEAEVLNYHDCGTGVGGELAANTTLGTPAGTARVAGTQSLPGTVNIYQTVATISFTSSLAITEHGIFSASTAGTLLDRSVFSAINVVNGDSIQFTYQLTINSGG